MKKLNIYLVAKFQLQSQQRRTAKTYHKTKQLNEESLTTDLVQKKQRHVSNFSLSRAVVSLVPPIQAQKIQSGQRFLDVQRRPVEILH